MYGLWSRKTLEEVTRKVILRMSLSRGFCKRNSQKRTKRRKVEVKGYKTRVTIIPKQKSSLKSKIMKVRLPKSLSKRKITPSSDITTFTRKANWREMLKMPVVL